MRPPWSRLRPLAPLPPSRWPGWTTVTSNRSRSAALAVSSCVATIAPTPPPSTSTFRRFTAVPPPRAKASQGYADTQDCDAMRQAGGATPTPQDSGPTPLPAAVARALRPGHFAGRETELALLADAWAAVGRGRQAALVLLEGEPGAGKTRLAAEQAACIAAAGGAAGFGRCDPDVPAPFRPWIGALPDLLLVMEEEDLAAHVHEHGGEVARLLGTAGGRLPAPTTTLDADPDAQRHRLLTAAVALVAGVARRHPLVIVLDDLQFADRASLLLLRELLDARDAPVLVIATVRDVAAEHREPWRALGPGFRAAPATRVLRIGGLDLDATRELVADRLGAGKDDVAGTLQAETDGNALFVVELLRHHTESEGDHTAPPRSIAEVVGLRAAALGGDAERVARYAASLGRTFNFDLLVHVLDWPAVKVLEAVEQLCAAGLAAEVASHRGWFQFSHGIVQHALAAGLTDLRRRHLHRRAAEWLAAIDDRDVVRTGELALHWAGAGSDFVAQAVGALMELGDHALDLVAFDDAVRAYAKALRLHRQTLPDPDAQTVELLLRLGDAERRAGVDGYSERLLHAAALAEAQHDTQRLVRAAIANSRGLTANFLETDERRVQVLEAALAAAAPDALADRALLLSVLSSELFAHRERRLELADEALETARAAGDERVLAEVLFRRCFTIAEPASVAERLQLGRELQRLGERLDDPLVRHRAALERTRALFEAGRADAPAEAGRVVELAPRVGTVFARWQASLHEAILHQRDGRYEEAETVAMRAAEQAIAVVPDAWAIFATQLLPLRWDQGRLGELADFAAQAADQSGAELGYRALVPLALAEAGREEEARARLDSELAAGLPMADNVLWMTSAALWSEGAIRLGHKGAAAVMLERITPWREQYVFTAVSLMGSVARLCAGLAALLGRHEDARRDYALAETVDGRIGAIGGLARTHLQHGLWLIAQGEENAGRERLERARAAATAHGLAGIATQATRDEGARPLDRSRALRASLQREGDVWTLGFDGRVTRLRDAKGIHHLVRLFSAPGVEIAATDLAGEGGAGARETGGTGPALDEQAKREYRTRVSELREEIEEAESFNDPERLARAREELEWIGTALSAAVGLGGRDRPQASNAERARVNVTRAIHSVLRRIGEHDERAGRVLADCIRTGAFCVYEPDPSRPVDWTL